ncbi:uncharacterized protein LOC111292362 [Durio zibethinus]|uniref:Uncharacterized protein LOC111292362 n=1 Tax=Durio zibethinus TaxID=66656 RepID=A0A6P5YIX7_DURZI|nr:uncharacterized protein LOC111292362 [Durio zibethinus]
MGIKLLNLHTIPWCFHLLSNHISCFHLQPEPPLGDIKLIKSDGLVNIYGRPINVSELMTEFPNHMVCRSDSFYIGQKIPALSEDEQLQLGHKYFLLPRQFFQSVLSFVTIASFANASSLQSSRESKNALLKKAAACEPFHIDKSSSGCLRIRVSDEFIWQLMEEGRMKDHTEESWSRVCTTLALQKQYAQLVGSYHWKPKLETIKEMEKRRKKSHSQLNKSHQHNVDVITCAKPSKPKIRIKPSRK